VGVIAVEGGVKADRYFDDAWKGNRKMGGGPLWLNTCHTIDAIRYIAGEILRVSAEISYDLRETSAEDSAVATLRFASGAIGSLFASDTAVGVPGPHLILRGTEAALTVGPLRLYAYHWPWSPREERALSVKAIDLRTESIDALAASQERFCQVIAGTAEPLTDAADARRTTAVIAAIHRAGETGQAIETALG
jgi:predicted dehydrogenase